EPDDSPPIDKQRLDEAVAEANRELDDSGLFNVVTDGEATRAMNVLAGLPPQMQGPAVEKLGSDQFNNLLGEVPTQSREELGSLVQNTHEPERKLELWAEYHKSLVQNDVERYKGEIGEGKSVEELTDDEKEARRRH